MTPLDEIHEHFRQITGRAYADGRWMLNESESMLMAYVDIRLAILDDDPPWLPGALAADVRASLDHAQEQARAWWIAHNGAWPVALGKSIAGAALASAAREAL